jgi:uncharacterized protein (TIGR03083 family)
MIPTTERDREAAVPCGEIPVISHKEAMQLAGREYDRALDLVRQLEGDDWTQPTDCTEWTVHDIVVHLLGGAEAVGSIRELLHQMRVARGLPKGTPRVDRLNAVHVAERRDLSAEALQEQLTTAFPRALRARRRAPGPMRLLPVNADDFGRVSYGLLNDVVITRDVFIHRVDISRATSRPMVLSADHEGRIVADVVRNWAAGHRCAFTLRLTGAAGGAYTSGSDGEDIEMDAIEFCRIVSGRAQGEGLLRTPVMF